MNKPGILVISDFTISDLVPLLQPQMAVTVAPFNQVDRTLLDGRLDCWQSKPDYALVWTRPEAAVSSFDRMLKGEDVSLEEVTRDVDTFVERLQLAATRVSNIFVPAWTLPPYVRGLGLLSLDPDFGHAHHLMRMNLRLIEMLRDNPEIYVLDAGRWLASAGPASSSPKLWHLGKIAFGPTMLGVAAADVKAAIHAIGGKSRKAIILDLDDTLWGGIVGDDGWENLSLGGHDPIGEAFVSFQAALKALSLRGIMLAIVSKNTEEVALEAIDKHPDMVLRRDNFVGWRINWDDKAHNIADLAVEVNIGLDAIVFIDDSPVERARVRTALPKVFVPDWPKSKMLFAQTLAELDCFDTPTFTKEDQSRTRMYVAERKRRTVEQSVGSVEEYLTSLNIKVTAEVLDKGNLMRAAQLLNKTNQMNLSTRRMTAKGFEAWSKEENSQVFVFRVSDRFESYGLTGLASLQVRRDSAFVADFVVSCRVIGRGVEETILHALSEYARSKGARSLSATYVPTARNMPCKQFLDRRSVKSIDEIGGNNVTYTWSLNSPCALPEHIQLDPGTSR